MTLAEAMRKGAAQHPQCFGGVFTARRGEILASCAMGAVEVGLYGARRVDGRVREVVKLDDGVEQYFPALWERAAMCPEATCEHECAQEAITLQGVIMHLNDGHHWTREAIADWVEGEEAAHGGD